MQILNIVCSVDIIGMLSAFLGTMLIVGPIMLLCSIGCYLIKAVTIFALSKRANAKNPWIAFIPIVQNAKIFNLAGFTDKIFYISLLAFFLAYLIPVGEIAVVIGILQIALTIYIRVRVARNFGGGIAAQILMCLFEPIMLICFALANKTHIPTPMNKSLEKFLKDYKLTDDMFDENLKEREYKSAPVDIPIVEEKDV